MTKLLTSEIEEDPSGTNDKINATLIDIENVFKINIDYACESGNRAWGFASKDSDYDVRFIYTRPREYYTSILPTRDVLDIVDFKEAELIFDDDDLKLDPSGWDLKKTLYLIYKSNVQILEWLNSPIIYRGKDSALLQSLKDATSKHWQANQSLYHYWNMAKGNYREYLKTGDRVWQKKYLYVLRSLFAVKHIELNLGRPPVNFISLLSNVHLVGFFKDKSQLYNSVINLLKEKINGAELGYGHRIFSLDQFIVTEFKRLEGKKFVRDSIPKIEIGQLEAIFKEFIK